ncbi:MAG: thioredoxin domain-containing protein [Bacteroidales bacterium]
MTLFALALFVGLTAVACDTGISTPPGLVVPTVSKYTTMPSNDEMLSEKVIGNASAPTTIYEYLSLWCTACATFHTTVELQMKSQFVDTGQAKIVFRNLYRYGAGETETAAMLARCVGNDNFFPAVDYIYTTQPRWLSAADPDAAVKSVMLGFGMSQSLVDTCGANTTLRNGLVQVHNSAIAQTYQLPDGTSSASFYSVPAIVVNGVKLDSTPNPDGSINPANVPTIDNIAKLVNGK